jgi:hypothetical protein
MQYKKELILGGIIFLVASLSFGIGFLTNREINHAPIIIEKCSEPMASSAAKAPPVTTPKN